MYTEVCLPGTKSPSQALKGDTNLTASATFPTQTDLHIVTLPNATSVRTYLDASGKITVANIDIFDYDLGRQDEVILSTWTDTTPYGHISTSSFTDSNIVYVYYQVNDTATVELRYDLGAGIWDLDPLSIHLDEYYGTNTL